VSPTNDYIATTFRVLQSIGLYIWFYSRRIDSALQDEISCLDSKLSMDLIASLTPQKQEILVHLRTQLQNVCGIAQEELPVFSELLAEWNEHCQDSLRMSEMQRTFSFSQCYLYYLDAINHFIITTLAVMELTPLLGSRPGATLTNTIEMNLVTGPGAAILGYFALGLHLQVPAEEAYRYASEGHLI
jgi:hypothetical protein